MHTTYEHGTKGTLSFSGGPHTPVNMADSMEEVNVGVKNAAHLLCCTALYFVRQVLWDFHRLFGSGNSPTTSILHTICHVYRSMWPAREDKPCWLALHSNVLCTIVKLAYIEYQT